MHVLVKLASVSFLALLLLLVLGFSSVMYRGMWPDTWPKELDRYRATARTFSAGPLIHEISYIIPFTVREEFEAAWPYILAVKSPKAPIILERGPSVPVSNQMVAGVRVRYPFPNLPGPPEFEVPNWPDDIETQSGEFPEYVVKMGGKWVSWNGQDKAPTPFRARVDIVLVVDGNIVDLNRIPLPPDTPIIDRRFTKNEVIEQAYQPRQN